MYAAHKIFNIDKIKFSTILNIDKIKFFTILSIDKIKFSKLYFIQICICVKLHISNHNCQNDTYVPICK